jgi:hypothetical protein
VQINTQRKRESSIKKELDSEKMKVLEPPSTTPKGSGAKATPHRSTFPNFSGVVQRNPSRRLLVDMQLYSSVVKTKSQIETERKTAVGIMNSLRVSHRWQSILLDKDKSDEAAATNVYSDAFTRRCPSSGADEIP